MGGGRCGEGGPRNFLGNIWYLDSGMNYMHVSAFVKTHRTVHLRSMCYIVCKLHHIF